MASQNLPKTTRLDLTTQPGYLLYFIKYQHPAAAVREYIVDELRKKVATQETADGLRTHTTNCTRDAVHDRSWLNDLLPKHAGRLHLIQLMEPSR